MICLLLTNCVSEDDCDGFGAVDRWGSKGCHPDISCTVDVRYADEMVLGAALTNDYFGRASDISGVCGSLWYRGGGRVVASGGMAATMLLFGMLLM